MQPSAMVILTIENGCDSGKRTWLTPGQRISVGTSPHSDFVVDEPELNPQHLSICLDESGCIVHATGGATFTHNDTPHRQNATVADGDAIQIGTTVIRVEHEGDGSAGVSEPHIAAVGNLSMATVAKQFETQNRKLVSSNAHDDDYSLVVPEGPVTTDDLVREIHKQGHAVFFLCRFDLWSFPAPEEVADCPCVPKANSKGDIPFLIRFFEYQSLESSKELMEQGFDSQLMMGLVSTRPAKDVLTHVRDTGGLFLSPQSMHGVIQNTQPGAIAAILGPIDGILLGSNEDWELYARDEILPIFE